MKSKTKLRWFTQVRVAAGYHEPLAINKNNEMSDIFTTAQWKYPNDWPPEEFFYHYMNITKEQVEELEELVLANVNERKIDKFLKDNPTVLVNCLKMLKSGNHGAWVLPQQAIKPSLGNNSKGLIPDYIIGGNSSDGFSWFVLELKGVEHNMFRVDANKKLHLSSTLNMAVCQTLEYIDYCAEQQTFLRDGFKLTDFREPRGLIIIGRENEVETCERFKNAKAAWNRYLGTKIEIRSYDSILRYANQEYHLQQSIK